MIIYLVKVVKYNISRFRLPLICYGEWKWSVYVVSHIASPYLMLPYTLISVINAHRIIITWRAEAIHVRGFKASHKIPSSFSYKSLRSPSALFLFVYQGNVSKYEKQRSIHHAAYS